MVHVFTSASCCEHGMGKMIYHVRISLPAVGVKESLNSPSRALYRVCMSPTPLINESDRVVDSAVCVTVGFQNPARRPAVTDDRSAVNNSHQDVSGSVRNGYEEGLSGLPFHTARHLPYFHSVCPLVLAPPEPDVDFDSLVRTADLLRTAKHILQHGLSAKSARQRSFLS
jgi:hypothetical protein